MAHAPQRILTGLQPSGALHIGNYFSSIAPFIQFVESADRPLDCFLMVADYHAVTTVKDPDLLRQNIFDITKVYLAAGIDPERVCLFRQSDNPDHTELAWILNCQVTVPFLMQAHSYKDKVAKGIEPNAGLFTYPMLMAADIVLYDIDVVPVGEDQRQHLEYTREAVGKFNRAYGDILQEPAEHILPDVGVVPGLDGQKMSKSYHNTIPLFATEEETLATVKKIVTDSEGSFPDTVYAIHRVIKSEAELAATYQDCAGRYGELKQLLAADLNSYLAPMRARYAEITDEEVITVLQAGAERARAASAGTMERVRNAIGITI